MNPWQMICDYYESKNPEKLRFKESSFLDVDRNSKMFKAGTCQQFKALAWRCSLIAKRQPILTYVRLTQAIVSNGTIIE